MFTFRPSVSSTSHTFLPSHSKQQIILFTQSLVILPMTLNPFIYSSLLFFFFPVDFSAFLNLGLWRCTYELRGIYFFLPFFGKKSICVSVSSITTEESEESRFTLSCSAIFLKFDIVSSYCLRLSSFFWILSSCSKWPLPFIFFVFFFLGEGSDSTSTLEWGLLFSFQSWRRSRTSRRLSMGSQVD